MHAATVGEQVHPFSWIAIGIGKSIERYFGNAAGIEVAAFGLSISVSNARLTPHDKSQIHRNQRDSNQHPKQGNQNNSGLSRLAWDSSRLRFYVSFTVHSQMPA